MTKLEFVRLMRFPVEWITLEMYPDELFQRQLAGYGENGVQRWINITNPQGATERVEYRHQAPGISYTES
ncbi:hypothetical protein ACQUJS_24290, partial [Ralstonia pseudosolanacearum]